MPWPAFVFFILLSVIAQYLLWRSRTLLTPGVSARDVWVRGPFAGRRFYTEEGWMKFKRGAVLQIIAFLGACAIWYALQPWW